MWHNMCVCTDMTTTATHCSKENNAWKKYSVDIGILDSAIESSVSFICCDDATGKEVSF